MVPGKSNLPINDIFNPNLGYLLSEVRSNGFPKIDLFNRHTQILPDSDYDSPIQSSQAIVQEIIGMHLLDLININKNGPFLHAVFTNRFDSSKYYGGDVHTDLVVDTFVHPIVNDSNLSSVPIRVVTPRVLNIQSDNFGVGLRCSVKKIDSKLRFVLEDDIDFRYYRFNSDLFNFLNRKVSQMKITSVWGIRGRFIKDDILIWKLYRGFYGNLFTIGNDLALTHNINFSEANLDLF